MISFNVHGASQFGHVGIERFRCGDQHFGQNCPPSTLMTSSGSHGVSQFGHTNGSGAQRGQCFLPSTSLIATSSGSHGVSQFGHTNGSSSGSSSRKHSLQYSKSSGPMTILFGGSTVIPQFGQLTSFLRGQFGAS